MGVACSDCSVGLHGWPESDISCHKSSPQTKEIVHDSKEEIDIYAAEHIITSRCLSRAAARSSDITCNDATPTASSEDSMLPLSGTAASSNSRTNGESGKPEDTPSDLENVTLPATDEQKASGGFQELGRELGRERAFSDPSPRDAGAQEMKPCGNMNRPQDYFWLRSMLLAVAENEASALDCSDIATGSRYTPLFFVMGACPNVLCGMQAVVYCVCLEGHVDFWWVKPSKAKPTELEKATLNRHSKGPHKNDPGRSRQFYKPLADVFEDGELRQGWRFGIEKVLSDRGEEAHRAYIQSEDNISQRLYVQVFWQEDWSMSPFSRSKYIKGKVVYQKIVSACQYFSRQYEIHDGVITISKFEEPPFTDVLLRDDLKQLWVLDSTGDVAH
eukprot:TRINITY_DN9867_c0_g2_i1.p1 TRINITY_DN9867_c0_g2~~TRINITY_DN9867_c0_g2_i1.p1  ORF type:complete len:388 (+),score=64.06 TRINITY_DN9867_c0_g2_i1:335-1498(+)